MRKIFNAIIKPWDAPPTLWEIAILLAAFTVTDTSTSVILFAFFLIHLYTQEEPK